MTFESGASAHRVSHADSRRVINIFCVHSETFLTSSGYRWLSRGLLRILALGIISIYAPTSFATGLLSSPLPFELCDRPNLAQSGLTTASLMHTQPGAQTFGSHIVSSAVDHALRVIALADTYAQIARVCPSLALLKCVCEATSVWLRRSTSDRIRF